MAKRIILVTGSLAEPRVKRIAEELNGDEMEPVVANVGVKVAALMTADIVERRLKLPAGADRVIMPGRFRGDLDRLSDFFGTRFERGPEEIADLPEYLGHARQQVDLSEYDVTIFAEIIDATLMTPAQIVERARMMRADGADIIDLGCLPDSPFPHLEDSIAALHADGFKVSVNSFNAEELSRATRAGADYLLSLSEKTIGIADEGPAIPVLVSAGAADAASLDRAIDIMIAKGKPFYADPILDPIHYGFAASIARYVDLQVAPSRRSNSDGDRQPHGAYGRRYDRHQRAADGTLLGAPHHCGAGCAGQPALPDGHQGIRSGTSRIFCSPQGQRPATRLRHGIDGASGSQRICFDAGGNQNARRPNPRR